MIGGISYTQQGGVVVASDEREKPLDQFYDARLKNVMKEDKE
jgi:hypothetical protein